MVDLFQSNLIIVPCKWTCADLKTKYVETNDSRILVHGVTRLSHWTSILRRHNGIFLISIAMMMSLITNKTSLGIQTLNALNALNFELSWILFTVKLRWTSMLYRLIGLPFPSTYSYLVLRDRPFTLYDHFVLSGRLVASSDWLLFCDTEYSPFAWWYVCQLYWHSW